MAKEKITVFTPTYNRAYCLNECYESLKKQKNKNFKWLIIDDGSTDNTKELVSIWQQNDNGFEIEYRYKENGGMHTAYNCAYQIIDTELSMNVDSDDHLSENAIGKILDFWDKNKSEDVGGILALDEDPDGNIIGEKFPDNLHFYKGWGLYYIVNENSNRKDVIRITGDKKFIGVTSKINEFPPIPVFKNEKYYSLYHKQFYLEKNYKILILNEPVCVVEYRNDSNSNQMYAQYKKCANGFIHFRKRIMKDAPLLRIKLRAAVHYVCECKLSNKKDIIKSSPKKLITCLAYPLGTILYIKAKRVIS